MNKDSHQKHEALISRYLSGNATDVEVQELEAWVAASSENTQFFMDMKKAWVLTGAAQQNHTIKLDKAWQRVSTQLKDGQLVAMPSKAGKSRWLGIAASLVLLATISFLLFQQFDDSGAMAMATTMASESFDLTDGSQITLNQSSSVTYVSDEESQQRKVTLVGDAFFDVARDEARPFIIQTKHLEIEVLGTSFYIDARDDENSVQVIVESGTVAVRANGVESILTANERVSFNKKGGAMMKQKNDDANFTALKTNKLVFENNSLEEVVFALNRQFNVDIQLSNPQLASCALTSTFNNKSLGAVLAIIESSLGIGIRQTQNKIIFEGSCTLE